MSINSIAQLGHNTQGIIDQLNRNTSIRMGYLQHQIPPKNPYLAHQFIINQYKTQINNNINTPHSIELMNELHEIDKKINNPHQLINTELLLIYQKSFFQINDMLIGKTKLSYQNAIYYLESAYGNTYLNYLEYQKSISQSANFILKWLKQKKHSTNTSKYSLCYSAIYGRHINLYN